MQKSAAAVPAPIFTEVAPRFPSLQACSFYHAFDQIEGLAGAQWDLRPDPALYLGQVDFRDRSVLEIGPASGFLTFHMEAAGAQVTCLEPTMAHLWDIVPIEGFDTQSWRDEFSAGIEGVRNSFWYMHRMLDSRSRMFEANPCNLPDAAGHFDIGVLAAVLMHCRNPFDMLQSVAARVRQTVVVTELHHRAMGDLPLCQFLPHLKAQQVHTWWYFSPQFFVSALGLLGFTNARVHFHRQKQPIENREVEMYTVVCDRPVSV